MSIALLEPLIICVICWPSARNLFFVHILPFSLLPLLGGVFYFFDFRMNLLAGADPYLASLLLVLILGATTHAVAFYLGFTLNTPLKSVTLKLLEKIKRVGIRAPHRLIKFVSILTIVSSVLQLFSYAKMGFAPIFADDPFAAKFYAGAYADTYAPVAPFLRFGFQIYVTVAPLFLVCFPKSFTKKIGYIIIVTIAAGTIFLSLKRGPIAVPFVDFVLALSVFYKSGKYSPLAMVTYVLVFALGSAANGILLYVLGLTRQLDPEVIFSGVPDISDLLMFWSGFQSRHYDLSFGRTVLGALIPYRYEWNPSVVTKLAIGASADAATGGFRLPDAVWGYVAFGYVGAVLWPAFMGAMAGIQMSLLRKIVYMRDLSFFQFYLMYIVMMGIMGFAGSLLTLSLDVLTTAFFTCCLIVVLLGRPGGRKALVKALS